MTTAVLTGKCHEWSLFDRKRTFGSVTIPFSQARECAMAVRYNAITNRGQQREVVESHLRKLKNAIESGEYTPTPGAANLSKKHREGLTVQDDGTFVLNLDSQDPLHLTDAGHRFEALNRIVKDLDDELAGEKSEKEKAKLERWKSQVLNAPVSLTLYFDGDSQRDFLNLQCGRPVDGAHLLSMKVQQRVTGDEAHRLAFEIAKLLNKSEGSPFQNTIRFDSRGAAALPINSLCSAGSSDIGTSLVGLARVGLAGAKPSAATSLAYAVQAVYKALKTHAEQHADEVSILDYGKVLTPISDGGKKGSATMMIGLGVCLAYRMSVLGHDVPTEDDLNRLTESAKKTLDVPVNGNFSGPTKRKLLGKFALDYLSDLECERHCGLPKKLLKTLSASTFGVEPLPKEPKTTASVEAETVAEPQQEEVQG